MKIFYRILHIYHELSLLKAKRNGLKVGNNFFWGPKSKIDPGFCHLVTIGDDVIFSGGGGVRVIAHDVSTRIHLNYTRIGKVNIGNRVYIGGGSSILPGVTIGNDVIIGAGSIVTRDIPSGSVACGNPAKVIKTIDEFIALKKKEMQIYPCFEKEYINETKTMKDKIGYIVE